VDTPEVVVLALLQGLNDRKPKVPPACIACITKAAIAFGATQLPLKELRSHLKGLLEHKDTNVRTAAMTLMIELVKWIGVVPLQSVIDGIRSAQQSEITAATKDITPGQCKPTVYLRKLR
jgi:cytoskeleton-associated protein 5